MSISTVAGLLIGIGLFLTSIAMATDNYLMFLSPSSLILVMGGTLATAFISYQGRYVLQALTETIKILGHAKVNKHILVGEIRKVIGWASVAQKGGIIALDQHLQKDEPDEYIIRYGTQLILSGYSADEVRKLMRNTINSTFDRSMIEVNVLRNMASTAPAFGMIGTLVGLIIMLQTMGDDSSSLGQGMAMALLTTLYGVLLARLIFQPASDKILHREEIVQARNYMMLEGLVMIAQEKSPQQIQDTMNSFLEPELIRDFYREARAASGNTSKTSDATDGKRGES